MTRHDAILQRHPPPREVSHADFLDSTTKKTTPRGNKTTKATLRALTMHALTLVAGAFRWRFSLALFAGAFRWRFSLALFAGASRWRFSLALLAGASRWRFSLALLAGASRWQCFLTTTLRSHDHTYCALRPHCALTTTLRSYDYAAHFNHATSLHCAITSLKLSHHDMFQTTKRHHHHHHHHHHQGTLLG